MGVLALLALLSCTPAEGPAGGPVASFPDLATPGGSRALRLEPQAARVDWQVPIPPEAADVGERWVLEAEEVPNPGDVPRALMVVRAKLPFVTGQGVARPAGMTVEVAGTDVPFSKRPAPECPTPTWRVNGKHLVLSLPVLPAEGELVVHWDAVRRDIDALTAGPALEASHTFRGITRHGLTLPAPSTAEWRVELPAHATVFDAWLTLPRAPLRVVPPDPASLVLEVVDGDQATEIARSEVAREKPGYHHWTADLSRYAGQEITLRLRADPHGNPWWDWIFVGSPTIRAQPEGEVRRIVVVALDTTRPDHFGFYGYERPTTPELDRIASESVTFDRTWSVAPRTRPAFRSSFTGRLPLDAVGAPNLAEHLQAEGWATAGIVANVHLQPRFDFDHGFDWWHYKNNADAEVQVSRALAWLEANADRDSFLFLHFMDPHMPYAAPGEWRDRFVTDPDPALPRRTNRWVVNTWTQNGEITDQRKAHLEALHDGELAYTSAQIGRLVDGLDALGGRTLLVLHTDHGEEFWDHGAFEHNQSLFEETTRAVLWMRPGGGLATGRRVTEPASLMDIAPTLAELTDLDDPPEFDGRSLAPFLAGKPTATNPRPIPVAYLQYERERWGVVWQSHKYILHTGTGQEELYDLDADPDEQQDKAASTELDPWRKALAEAHEIEVFQGLRVFVGQAPAGPFTLEFPQPVQAAGVLDPETTIQHRANLEWGEKPVRALQDVGSVTLDDNGLGLVFTPGPNPAPAVIWVRTDTPIDPTRVIHGEDVFQVRIEAGTIVVPPPGEAARMRALRGDEAVDDEELEKLKALGYVEEDDDEETDP